MKKKSTNTFSFDSYLKSNYISFKKEVILKDLHKGYDHRFKIDYCFYIKDRLVLAMEIEGGTWSNGRHTSPVGFVNDMLKYNSISLFGIPLIRFTTEMIEEYPVYCANMIIKYLINDLTINDISEYVAKFKLKSKTKSKSSKRKQSINKLLSRVIK